MNCFQFGSEITRVSGFFRKAIFFGSKNRQNKKGRWNDVFSSFFLLVFLCLSVRWLCFEPFVIPSGSMEQTLLVRDYVLVKKWAYGLRLPFSETWIFGPWTPKRGDIAVFRDKDLSGRFIVKRVIGLPGDRVSMDEKGVVSINGHPFEYQIVETGDEDVLAMTESNGQKSYRVQYLSDVEQNSFEFHVPKNEIFMMGDNRNQSSDSRYWGGLPMERLVGKLFLIWLSCRESEVDSEFLCPPGDFRVERLFRWVQ